MYLTIIKFPLLDSTNSMIESLESTNDFFIFLISVGFISVLLIGLILFSLDRMKISSIINKEEITPKTETKKPNTSFMNMLFYETVGNSGRASFFVYDSYDTSGAKLHALFAGKMYETCVMEGVSGLMLDVYSRRQGPLIPVPALTTNALSIEAAGCAILSKGTPVVKTVPRSSNGGTTTFHIRER